MYQCLQNDQQPNFFINQPIVFLLNLLNSHTFQQNITMAVHLQKKESLTE